MDTEEFHEPVPGQSDVFDVLVDPAPPRVLGLDLAAECSGVALPDGSTTTITAPRASGSPRTLADNLDRMDFVTGAVEELLEEHRPRLVVLEDYAPGAKGASAHRLAEVGGCVRLACYRAGAALVLVGTRQVKLYATGKGTAQKSDMRLALYKRAALEVPTEDEVDAWWLRAMGRDRLGSPSVVVPASHRRVLENIMWPEVALGGAA
jgi:Holliday junction resolvasome RuvABC endonuclease subunit